MDIVLYFILGFIIGMLYEIHKVLSELYGDMNKITRFAEKIWEENNEKRQ